MFLVLVLLLTWLISRARTTARAPRESGAVLTEESNDLATGDRDADPAECVSSAKANLDRFRLENRVTHLPTQQSG